MRRATACAPIRSPRSAGGLLAILRRTGRRARAPNLRHLAKDVAPAGGLESSPRPSLRNSARVRRRRVPRPTASCDGSLVVVVVAAAASASARSSSSPTRAVAGPNPSRQSARPKRPRRRGSLRRVRDPPRPSLARRRRSRVVRRSPRVPRAPPPRATSATSSRRASSRVPAAAGIRPRSSVAAAVALRLVRRRLAHDRPRARGRRCQARLLRARRPNSTTRRGRTSWSSTRASWARSEARCSSAAEPSSPASARRRASHRRAPCAGRCLAGGKNARGRRRRRRRGRRRREGDVTGGVACVFLRVDYPGLSSSAAFLQAPAHLSRSRESFARVLRHHGLFLRAVTEEVERGGVSNPASRNVCSAAARASPLAAPQKFLSVVTTQPPGESQVARQPAVCPPLFPGRRSHRTPTDVTVVRPIRDERRPRESPPRRPRLGGEVAVRPGSRVSARGRPTRRARPDRAAVSTESPSRS